MDGLKYLLWRCLMVLAFALALSYVWPSETKHNAHAAFQAHAQASEEAAEANQAWEQVYGHMSDSEKLRGDAEVAK